MQQKAISISGARRAGELIALSALLIASGTAQTLNRAATPAGLSSADWAAIRAEYEAHRHAAAPAPGGYKARNPGQQWTTHFDGRGFTVKPDRGSGAGACN